MREGSKAGKFHPWWVPSALTEELLTTLQYNIGVLPAKIWPFGRTMQLSRWLQPTAMLPFPLRVDF